MRAKRIGMRRGFIGPIHTYVGKDRYTARVAAYARQHRRTWNGNVVHGVVEDESWARSRTPRSRRD